MNANNDKKHTPLTKGQLLPPHDDEQQLPAVVQRPDAGQLKQFITEIKSAETQVGEHLIQALQDPDNVAVLTTVVSGPDGRQHIVSAALNPDMMEQVQSILAEAQQQREEDIPCVGFHCYVRPRNPKSADGKSGGKSEDTSGDGGESGSGGSRPDNL